MHHRTAEISLCISDTAPGLPHHPRIQQMSHGKNQSCVEDSLALPISLFSSSLSTCVRLTAYSTLKISKTF
jgi:hypothetical protein